jgi:signal transduction histidine kinase
VGLRRGVQAEVLLSLALVMVTGTALLAAFFIEISHARIEALHGLLGDGFVVEAESQTRGYPLHLSEGGVWWRIDHEGRVFGLNASENLLDSNTRSLAEQSLEAKEALVESGAPWSPIRFASPDVDGGSVVTGRIDAPVSGVVLAGLVFVDVLIFGLFGVTMLRRRVVGPLHRLAHAVREIGDGEIGEGGLPATVPVEGVAEVEALGTAFNEMHAALAARTGALEKAIHDLRGANANLLQARDGLDRAERLAMVGSLAAGVAHEVGNPMGALLAFLDVASRDTGLGNEGRHCLERAIEQGDRVRLILRQLLDFSRPPQIEHTPIALEDVAHQVVELVSAQSEFSDIEFEVSVDEGVGRARGDSSIASQILLNLALNAASAMQDSARKKIRFEVGRTVERRREGEIEVEDGTGRFARTDSIVCRVADSGPGIDVDESERIFDPFFTTKAPGEGTGLGLANARRLAQELGGSVEVDPAGSEFGGALFHLVLPAEEVGVHSRVDVRSESGAQLRIP